MKQTAKYLAAQGRNGDTELLHVSRSELAQLHGIGSLFGAKVTTNPHTGLPEAFNFKSLIPAIVGIGGTILSGGTLSPLMAGLISGAGTTAATGDIKQGILSGITGGMLSGLGTGLAHMGGAEAAAQGTGDAINSAAHFSDAGFAANQAAQSAAPSFSDAAFSAGMPNAVGGVPYSPSVQPFTESAVAAPAASAAPASSGFSANTFMQNAMNPDKWAENFGGDKLMSRTVPGGLALASTIGDAMMPTYGTGGDEQSSEDAKKEKTQTRKLTMPNDPYYAMHGGEHSYFGAPVRNFAAGGGVMSLPNGQQADSGITKVIRAIRSRYRSRKDAVDDMQVQGSFMQQLGVQDPNDPVLDYAFGYTKKQGQHAMKSGNLMLPMGMAEGGIVRTGIEYSDPAQDDYGTWKRLQFGATIDPSSGRAGVSAHAREGSRTVDRNVLETQKGTRDLGAAYRAADYLNNMPRKRMAMGGAVTGPGDGMSDSVPASINGKQPARLASDEFVVPADVVSGIGNGSSKAGHEQLYDMIARVRAARTGRTQQAPAINPKKVLPR